MKPSSIKDILRNTNKRSLRACKNLSVSFVAKIASLAIIFIIVPITLNYVGKAEYGIWLTISSIITWFTFFDIGLGNGLRNKLAVALAKNDLQTARTYISSAYFLITMISLVLFVIFFIFSYFVSWNAILNTQLLTNNELFKITILVFSFFCLSFSMKTISSVLEALQLYAIKDIIAISTQLIGLAAILILVQSTEGSLFYLSLVYGSQTALGLILASVILYSGKLKHLRPSISHIRIKESLPLINLGIWFFLNQILYLISTQTSIFIVVQLFGPDDVTVFNLARNYMSISSMLFIMVLSPFLSAFTEAYTKSEYQWIKTTMRQIFYAFIVASVLTIIMVIGYKLFFNLWVNGKVMPDLTLIIMLGIFGILQMIASVYTLFLNGIGKIRLQFYTLLVTSLLFVPMVFLFYKLNLGLSSLVLPGILFGIINSIIYKMQFTAVMQNNAKGIWNK